ncbi:MAG: chromosome partitioning protein [Actinomycetota bacterium]|nr:chromosome partitioning protein [Actinomycetota bacterium]
MSIDGDLRLTAQSPAPARSDSDSAEIRREEGRPLTDGVAPIEISTYSEDEGSVNGHAVTKGVHSTIHDACIALTVPYALQSGGPVLIHAIDTIGTPTEFWLHVHPDGRATPAAAPTSTQRSAGNVSDQAPQSAAAVAATAATGEPGVVAAAEAHVVDTAVIYEAVVNEAATGRTRAARRHAATESESGDPAAGAPPISAPSSASAVTPAPAGPALAPSPAPMRVAPELPAVPTLDDLLATRPPLPPGPAQLGWRAAIRRLTSGLVTLGPAAAEISQRQAIAAVQRSLTAPKTVVVINPKGGANKTTATLLIAATFGIHRGGYTLAWDNNETRGTMGWRASQGRHTNTAVDLLRELDRFDDARWARVGDLDNFVRAQGSSQFDVLASDEDAASAAAIDADAFNSLHRSLSRFYRMIVVDTGNNMRASNWDAALAAADQIVIVSTIREDTAQSAAWVADALNEKGFKDKVANAVTVLAAPSVRPDPDLTARLTDHFGRLTRAVVQVPFDPALVSGGPIDMNALSAASKNAWLQATALVADGL